MPNEAGKLLEICQSFFLATFDISRKQVRTALAKQTEVGGMEKDLRGFNINHNKMSGEVVERVIAHICRFKTVESHYVRKNSAAQYLPGTLDMATMHRLYLTNGSDEGELNPVSYSAYRTIFQQHFNIKFHKPKKDRCDTCDGWENLPEQARSEEMHSKKIEHDQEKDLSREFKKDVKELARKHSHIKAAAFDFQKTLLIPAGNSSSFYYSLRLRQYNFTVTDISDLQHINCYLWNEAEAGKGANEVSSALLSYLHDLHEKNIKEVYLFCDRCAGQNCNRMVFIMITLAMSWYGFSKIVLSFFITGHSQNENDTAHALIEREAQRVQTFTSSQWETVISYALTKNNEKRNVGMHAISHESILDFKKMQKHPLFKHLFRQTSKKDEKIQWSKIIQAKFTAENKEKMLFKYLYSQKDFFEVDMMQLPRKSGRYSTPLDGQHQQFLPAADDIPKCYPCRPGITKEKFEALQKLCKKHLIPPQHHQFYVNLPLRESKSDNEEEDE